MTPSTVPQIHEVTSGVPINGTLAKTFLVGNALSYDDKNYIVLKLWMYPRERYFIRANPLNPRSYGIYTKCTETSRGAILDHRVGYGRLTPGLKHYLELTFKQPEMKVYLSLFPNAA